MTDTWAWILDLSLLAIIVLQGFFVMFFEYDVWRMNRLRFNERAKWRAAKQKASKSETKSKGSTTEEVLPPQSSGQ